MYNNKVILHDLILLSQELLFIQCSSSRPEVFLGKGVMKICNKFTREHPCRSVISINLLGNFIETLFRHQCSPVNLLHIFRTPFPRNTSGWLLLTMHDSDSHYETLFDSGFHDSESKF